MSKKTIGIVGGMGPLATADLFYKIISHTDAAADNEHIHILIDNYPQIPDRTEAITAGDDTPAKYIAEAGKRLQAAGADFLIIPCNTSHYFYDKICSELMIPVISMVEETAKEVSKLGIKNIGLLATDGVLKTGLYEKAFSAYNIETVKPDNDGQARVMSLIYDEVKAGKEVHPEKLFPDMAKMENEGAKIFVLACTELPLAFAGVNKFKTIDPTDILAKVSIINAGYKVKNSNKAGGII